MNILPYNAWLDTMREEAYAKAEERGIVIENGRNNTADAFRHTYTSAKMARDLGRIESRLLGTANEVIHKNDVKERFMDEYNNNVGRALGEVAKKEKWTDDQLADAVKKAIDEKIVITDIEQVTPEQAKQNPYFIPETKPDLSPSPTTPKAESSQEEGILVHLYARKTGDVKGHKRSRPDGDINNNFSFRK
jgi:hypothetical protein